MSFFRLAEKNWSSFKDAFYNPEECVFTTYPETHSILKKVASSGSCIFINNLGDDTKELLFKSICGLANSDGGFIFIGAESINSINGLPVDKIESYESVFKEIIERIPGLSDYRINGYPIKDKSLVFVLKVSQSDDLISIEDDYHIYFYKERKIEVLNAAKVQSLITQRLTSRFSDKINTELDSIRKKTTAIDTFIKSLPILNSFFNRSVFLTSVTSNIEPITPIHLTTQQFVSLNNSYEKHSNGLSRGNVFYLDDVIKPRLSDAYLRITLPRYYLKGIKALKGEPSLYMVPGGAVFYSDNPLNCFYRTMEPVLKIEINKDYPIKFLCAYLKSSFYLWYLLNKYNTLDIIPPSSFNNIRIPQLNLKNPKELSIVSAVEQLVDQITCAEKAFLLKQNSVKDPEELYKVTVEHNESVKTCFETIDDLFYSLLAVSDNEKLIIQDNLRVNSIFVPNQVNSIH